MVWNILNTFAVIWGCNISHHNKKERKKVSDKFPVVALVSFIMALPKWLKTLYVLLTTVMVYIIFPKQIHSLCRIYKQTWRVMFHKVWYCAENHDRRTDCNVSHALGYNCMVCWLFRPWIEICFWRFGIDIAICVCPTICRAGVPNNSLRDNPIYSKCNTS